MRAMIAAMSSPSPAPFPRRINVEVTNHCNQRCTLCPRQDFSRPLGFMARDVFERVARECARHATKLWLHFLGEPLLHKDLVGMVRFAKDVGVREVGLSTNGVTLEHALAEAVLASGLDRLECSLDANDRERYGRMRGSDDFARVTANVRAFLDRKRQRGQERPVTSIQFMRTPAVEASLEELVDAWRPHLGPRDFVMTIVPATFAGAIDVPAPTAATRPACPWLFSSLMVLQDGTVTMCGADWDAQAPLGNVRESTLAAIWHGQLLTARRQAHLGGRFDAVSICAACTDWRLADGSGYQNVLADREQG